MSAPRVTIIETGVANTASVAAAFRRLGAHADITADRNAIEHAEHLVLPGVGTFGAGARTLDAHLLRSTLRARIEADRPTLAVCLGMQLLFASSDESPGTHGLALYESHVRAFPPGVRTPQFGWNRVVAPESARFLRTGYAYFANSFRITDAPANTLCARSDHGGPFVAALERGNLLACQFHPELSGSWGIDLLGRWLQPEAISC
ncbi:MAG: imidazole glycerol phosphate synthase subunit HisH [Planctomycetota bacterium]